MDKRYISTGSTLLNLVLTGNHKHGWEVGKISNIYGDESTGKTLIAIESAMALLNLAPKGYKPSVLYLDAESAFNYQHADRIGLDMNKVAVVPMEDSGTIEDFFNLLQKFCNDKANDPKSINLVILDSLDALSSKAEQKQEIDEGSYSMSKQKKLSEMFRRLVRLISKSNTHLMIISQTRDNINAGQFAKKTKRAGGKALAFYCSQIIFLKYLRKLQNTTSKQVYGVEIEAEVTKDKLSRPFGKAQFPIQFNYGIDDISSMLSFVLGEHAYPNLIDADEAKIKKTSSGRILIDGDETKWTKQKLIDEINDVQGNPNLYKTLLKEAINLHRRLEETIPSYPSNKTDLHKLRDSID